MAVNEDPIYQRPFTASTGAVTRFRVLNASGGTFNDCSPSRHAVLTDRGEDRS